MTVSKELIQNVEKIRNTLNEISVYNLDVKTSLELYYILAKKVNEVINELSRFEGVVSDEVVEQNKILTYLLGEGLTNKVVERVNDLLINGTIQSLVNDTIFNNLNTKIDKIDEQFNYIKNQSYKKITDINNVVKSSSINRTINKFENSFGNYAILGDSITDTWSGSGGAGGGASSADKGYPQVLHKLLKDKYEKNYGDKIKFTNRGFGGQTVYQSMQRIDSEIIPFNYDMVGVALGTNDWNQQVSLDVFYNHYKQLILKLLTETNADIFLVSLGYFDNWESTKTIREDEYNKVIKRISDEFNLLYIDTREAMINYIKVNNKTFEDITYSPDPVHPNDLGHEIWANACFEPFNNYSKINTSFREKDFTNYFACDGSITYIGNWSKEGEYESVNGGYIKVTNTLNDYCYIDFFGTECDVVVLSDNNTTRCIDILVDDEIYLANINTRSEQFNLKYIKITGLKNGVHRISVQNKLAERMAVNCFIAYNKKEQDLENILHPKDILFNDSPTGADFNEEYKFGRVALNVYNTDLTDKDITIATCNKFSKAIIYYTQAPTGCTFDVYLDDKKIKTVDTYNVEFVLNSTFEIDTNLTHHKLVLKIVGKNENASVYSFAFGGIEFFQ